MLNQSGMGESELSLIIVIIIMRWCLLQFFLLLLLPLKKKKTFQWTYLQFLFISGKLSKGRSENPEGDGRDLNQEVDEEEAITANVVGQLQIVD